MRRGWMQVLMIVVAAGALVLPTAAEAAERGPIKIGFLAPFSGGGAQTGKDMLNSFELALDEAGRQAAGRKIEMIVEDDEGVSATGLAKARKLVERDKIHILAGIVFAHVGYALAPYADASRIPFVYPVTAPDDLTQRKPAKWVIRVGWTGSQTSHPFGEYACKTLGYKRVALMVAGFTFGWEASGGFQLTFEESGCQVVQRLWVPLNAQDFAPYLSQIKRDANAVFAIFFGPQSLRLVKQYQELGLKDKVSLIGNGILTDEHFLPSMGDEAVGVITALHYSEALDNPANKRFREAFLKKAGKIASYYSANAYDAGRWIVEAIKAVNGNVEDRDALLAALRKVELRDSSRGPFRLDADNNPIQNTYIRKVEKVGGWLQNTVIYTYPDVSQYWKYNREEYLKQPVYDRNNPPCRFCD